MKYNRNQIQLTGTAWIVSITIPNMNTANTSSSSSTKGDFNPWNYCSGLLIKLPAWTGSNVAFGKESPNEVCCVKYLYIIWQHQTVRNAISSNRRSMNACRQADLSDRDNQEKNCRNADRNCQCFIFERELLSLRKLTTCQAKVVLCDATVS